jgi:DNA-binding NarL/FixJ family response regulator
MAIRLLIADDHRLILQALRRSFALADDIEIVGEARIGSQVLPLISQTNPDIVLLDVRMPELDGFTCITRARKSYPQVKFVVLSAFADEERVKQAFDCGATGYITKSVDPLELPDALRRAHAGESFKLGLTVPDGDPGGAGLTEREVEMLEAVARGLSNQSISREFWITEQTVKFHLTNIYRKLGVSNRTEAARYAFSNGLIGPSSSG